MNLFRFFITLSFIFLFENQGISQNWEKWYSKSNANTYNKGVIEFYDKGFLLAGRVYPMDDLDIISWLVKTTINGDSLWTKELIGDESLYINGIIQASDGGIVFCGTTILIDKAQPFVAKLNVCGEKEWCTVFQTYSELPWAQDIVETSSGEIGVIVNQFDEGNESYLFKLNAEGELIWKRPFCDQEQYQDSRKPIAESLILVEDEFLITGNVYWKNPDDDLYPIRPLFTMYDSDGNEKFVLPFGVQDGIIGDANASIQIESDRFIGVGSYWTDKKDALLMEFDNQGNELNYKIFNSSEIHPSYNASVLMSAQKIDDRYYFESYAGVEVSGNPVTEFSTTDDLFGSGFEVIDLLQHPDSRSPISNMAKTHDDKLLCAMTDDAESEYRIYLTKLNTDLEQDSIYTANYEYDYLCDDPIESGTIYLDDCNIIVGTNNNIELNSGLSIRTTPNPVNSNITIQFTGIEDKGSLQIQITNILGNLIYSSNLLKHQTELSLNTQNWKKGLYLINLKSQGNTILTKKIVKI